MRLRSLLYPVLASALWASAAACGDGGTSSAAAPEGVPSLAGENTDVAADDDATGGEEDVDPQERALAFARCMRENGLPDFPDPQVGENGGVMIMGPGAGSGVDEETMRAAHEQCQHLMGGGSAGQRIDPEEAARMQEAMLAFARCMREHGVDFPDPTFGGDGGGGTVTMGGPGLDPNDPEFADAQEACREFLPMPGEGAVTVSNGAAS
jgi:hypothetical protein